MRKRCWTVVALVAVCALFISVATRYTCSRSESDGAVKVIQRHSSSEPGLQRLLNNAAGWIPPVVSTAVLQEPGYHPHVVPSGPSVSSVLLEENLYNRPPPSVNPILS